MIAQCPTILLGRRTVKAPPPPPRREAYAEPSFRATSGGIQPDSRHLARRDAAARATVRTLRASQSRQSTERAQPPRHAARPTPAVVTKRQGNPV